MVEVSLFHFRDRDTLLNRSHPLTKIACLLACSTFIARSGALRALLCLILFATLALIIRLPIRSYRRELRFFFVMGTLMAVASALHFRSWEMPTAIVARFAAIVLMGLLFSDTTAPDDLARAIGHALEPIFPKRGYRAGATLELTLSTIPLLFDVASQVSQARKARGESVWRHPVRRIVSYGSTVFTLLLQRAEELESALRSRNFDPDALRDGIPFNRCDVILLSLTTVVLGLFFLLT
ncbi:MAG: energy-coupling factor transporter transmembrane component T [Sphaerochaetaceae bacterium]|jgi:biotin transport system permease protein|nr:energy-coupling factor transporter transmembrane component T [Sphaerochaetaceae bacterium]MDX9940368.1 energy-coupling factor transporter transmembrane component T [Sphaerochaetaceae bacterium]